MLRDVEKKKLNKGMYIRFVLSTKQDIVPAIVLVTGMRNVFYTERTDDGKLIFILSFKLRSEGERFQDIIDVENEIGSLFDSDEVYCLDFVTSNNGEYGFRVFGHVGDGIKANMFLPNETVESYEKNTMNVSELDKELVEAYYSVFHAVIEEI